MSSTPSPEARRRRPRAGDDRPDIDAVADELRTQVAARRERGDYPPGLEDRLAAQSRHMSSRRAFVRRPVDPHVALRHVAEALPLDPRRIPVASDLPGGAALHKLVSRVVARQTQGMLEQVQAFAEPLQDALGALHAAVTELDQLIDAGLRLPLDALLERQAAQERGVPLEPAPAPLSAWLDPERLDAILPTRPDSHYRRLALGLTGFDPVLDIGCGRGRFLAMLREAGVEASGVDVDPARVEAAAAAGLPVRQEHGLRRLERSEDATLGAITLLQVVQYLTPQEVVDLVALAADKLRPGGQVLVETVNPQSLSTFAHRLHLDPAHLRPVHPAYIAFLFREAGFTPVEIEWGPSTEKLQPLPAGGAAGDGATARAVNANVERLNRLLFGPQDYLLSAIR